MKFAIFSPLVTHSAIGRVTALVVRALQALEQQVVIVRTEQNVAADELHHSCTVEQISWTDTAAVMRVTQDADLLVYQVGNNYELHCGAMHWLDRLPGIVCLHDFVVAHLFAGWAQSRPKEALRVLKEWYGEEVATRFFNVHDGHQFMEDASTIYPMTEWVCAMADGVISHSHWGMRRVTRACAGPVRAVPLPYDAPFAVKASSTSPARKDMVNVITVGHANSNKRIESVIQAIGSSALLRHTIHYRLCGRIEPAYAIKLIALARSLGVQLTVAGETDSTGLQIAINEADIACCLRWPSFEAASATAIEGLLYGKAVIVTDTSFYSELPDDCVLKIPHQSEVPKLMDALEFLCMHPEKRRAMAVRGQQWATATFTARNYAENLVQLTRPIATAKPLVQMADRLMTQMRDWGASSEMLLADAIVEPLLLFQLDGTLPESSPLPDPFSIPGPEQDLLP